MKRYLLSIIDTTKYSTTKIKLMPHARCTDPFGSPEHDVNIFVSIRLNRFIPLGIGPSDMSSSRWSLMVDVSFSSNKIPYMARRNKVIGAVIAEADLTNFFGMNLEVLSCRGLDDRESADWPASNASK